MPLSTGKGKEARQKNVEKEIAAGKQPKQAVAIAYAQQRKNKSSDGKKTLDSLKSSIRQYDEAKHDPKSGQFTAGSGGGKSPAKKAANPANSQEKHSSQAAMHTKEAVRHDKESGKASSSGKTGLAQKHLAAMASHQAAAELHENAASHRSVNSTQAEQKSSEAHKATHRAATKSRNAV